MRPLVAGNEQTYRPSGKSSEGIVHSQLKKMLT